MRGIRMRFEEQPGLCRKTRQAIPAAIRRGLEKRRKSPTPCSTPMTCCATPEGTERQEEDVAQDLGGLQEYRRITPMALFALQAAADAGEPRVRLNPWRDWPPRQGSARRLRLHVAEHRLQAEQAGIAQGAQFVEADAGEDFHAAQRIGAAQGLLQLAGTAGQGAGANGGSAALDGMQGRGAALDIALAELAFELGEEVPCPERSAATPGRSAPGCRRNADDIAPRLDQFARVRCRCRRAPGAAPAEMTEQAKHQALLVDRLRHMVVHARRGAASRSASEALAVMAGIGSPAKRPSARILRSPRDHRYPASACPSAPRRTARSPPAPAERPPARRRRGPPGRPRCSTARRRRRFSALSSTTSRRTPRNRWVRSTGRGGGLAGRPVRRATHAAPSRPVAWA